MTQFSWGLTYIKKRITIVHVFTDRSFFGESMRFSLADYKFHICIGVTTIAGGKWGRRGHSDGASEDAKFSTDFEIVFVASSCPLLVVDRGERAIREIQLNFDDCAHQYETGFPLGKLCHLAKIQLMCIIEHCRT